MDAGSPRSPTRIERADLPRLGVIAAEAEAGPSARNPRGTGRCRGRLLRRALRKGAGQHHLREHGIECSSWPPSYATYGKRKSMRSGISNRSPRTV
jgi:hypothetical protein